MVRDLEQVHIHKLLGENIYDKNAASFLLNMVRKDELLTDGLSL